MIKIFDIKTNYNCNSNCIHCFIADRRYTRDLSLAKIKTLIGDFSKGDSVVVSGGEPTIDDNFIEVIK